jgi:hypothetical protein
VVNINSAWIQFQTNPLPQIKGGRTNKMPKDPKRNRSYYDIGGGDINQFEFHQNQGAITEEEHQRFQRSQAERGETDVPEAGPQSEAERIEQMMEAAREKVARRKSKQSTQTAAQTAPAANAKKTAKKTATKPAPAKSSAKKAAAGKSSATAKASTKKAAAKKKGSAKKSASGKSSKSVARKAARKS